MATAQVVTSENQRYLFKISLTERQKRILFNLYLLCFVAFIVLLATHGFCEGWDDMGDEGMAQAKEASQGTLGAAITVAGIVLAAGRMALGGERAGKDAMRVGGAGIIIGAATFIGEKAHKIGVNIAN